jgi:hypothetical protein
MKTRSALALLALLLFSCNNSTPTSPPTGDSTGLASDTLPGSEGQASGFAFDAARNFCYTYQGRLDGKPVQLHLAKAGKKLYGSYVFEGQAPLPLNEGTVVSSGVFSIRAVDADYQPVAQLNGRFRQNGMEAVWLQANPKRIADANLTRLGGDPSQTMEFQVFHDEAVSHFVPNDTTSPRLTTLYTVLFPASHLRGPAVDSLYQYCLQQFGDDAVPGNPWESLKRWRQRDFQRYREAIAPFAADRSLAASNNWSAVAQMKPVFNGAGLLSLAFEHYQYSGGAHGNYTCAYASFDLATGRKLVLSDVFAPGHERGLLAKLADRLRQRYQLPAGAPLADAGFYEEEIELTENFYLTDQGIGFYYSPYSIAPYAMGAIEIFLPFSECRAWLQPKRPWMAQPL